MSTTTVQYDVLDGPSADRVIDSFKYAHTKGCTVTVEFTLTPRDPRLRAKLGQRKVTGTVVALQYESGAPGMFILWVHVQMPHHSQTVKGSFYDANQRKGVLEFDVPTNLVDRLLG